MTTVWVLVIEHRYGRNISVCTTVEKAEALLLDYVREWWPQDIGDDEPMPEEPTEAIRRYFKLADEHEDYFIEETEMQDG